MSDTGHLQNFSSIIKLTDLDDFITPSQECVKPVNNPGSGKLSGSAGSAKVQIGGDGSYVQISEGGEQQKLLKASITLNDCLACSGCITSAESVLIGQQSHKEFLKLCNEIQSNSPGKAFDKIAIALPYQPILSFAARFNISPNEARAKLVGLFRQLGVKYVFDMEIFSDISLAECGVDFIERFKKKSSDYKQTPVLASACPGWVCYAEKTHGDWLLPYLSEVKSPQQIAGDLIKDVLLKKMPTSRLAVVTIMPCFDKKLEASRSDFVRIDQQSQEVDMVLTPVELEQMMVELGIDFLSIQESDVDLLETEYHSEPWTIPSGSGSGGYAEYVMRFAARELYGIDLQEVSFKQSRNSDLLEAVLEKDGQTLLSFAIVNGFRNIQNLVQKIKRKKCTYDYVEVMACPSGCLNGGAQLRPIPGTDAKSLARSIQALHLQMRHRRLNDDTIHQFKSSFMKEASEEERRRKVKTSFHVVQKSTNALTVKW